MGTFTEIHQIGNLYTSCLSNSTMYFYDYNEVTWKHQPGRKGNLRQWKGKNICGRETDWSGEGRGGGGWFKVKGRLFKYRMELRRADDKFLGKLWWLHCVSVCFATVLLYNWENVVSGRVGPLPPTWPTTFLSHCNFQKIFDLKNKIKAGTDAGVLLWY